MRFVLCQLSQDLSVLLLFQNVHKVQTYSTFVVAIMHGSGVCIRAVFPSW